MLSEYEIQRQKNIAANLAILASLGLEKPAPPKPVRQQNPKPKPKSHVDNSAKRKTPIDDGTGQANEEDGSINCDGRRKSARIKNATARSTKDNASGSNNGLRTFEDDDYVDYDEGGEGGEGRKIWRSNFGIKGRKDKPNNKIYGSIKGVEVNAWWPTRMECSNAGVHAPWVAGISGDPQKGAWSVAISGGYEDDIDEGFRFTFTGEGGRDLKGTKQNPKNLRTGPQAKDQVLERGNLSLKRSCETGKPVRVIRGFKGDPKLAPSTGYRYDGLYQVLKWWEDTGMSGYKVYKFAFKRMDGQPPIDLKVGDPAYDGDEVEDQDEEIAAEQDGKTENSAESVTAEAGEASTKPDQVSHGGNKENVEVGENVVDEKEMDQETSPKEAPKKTKATGRKRGQYKKTSGKQ